MTHRDGTWRQLVRLLMVGALALGPATITTSVATATGARPTGPGAAPVAGEAPVAGAAPAAPVAAEATLSGTRPNIVLIVTDDQTAASLPYMPYLSQQLDSGAYVNFTEAEVNNSICCPSRASILTGQVDTRTGVTNNAQALNLDPTQTIGPALQGVGYRTGIFGKLLNGYGEGSGIWPGWTDFQPFVSRNVYAQYNYQLVNNGVPEHYGAAPEDYAVDVLTSKSVQFIDDTPPGKPFLLYVAPTATHTPFVAAPRHDGAYARTRITLPDNFAEADVSDKPAWVRDLPVPGRGGAINVRRDQFEAALGVDDMIRSIDQKLAATDRIKDTVFIFISDNGLSMGSNRWSSKTCELRGCVSVPLVVRYPGQAGRTDDRLVSNVDIAPTLVDLAGATLPVSPDGTSLVSALEDPTGSVLTHPALLEHWPGGDQEGRYASATYPVPGYYGIRTERWRYVEVTNLAVKPGRTEYELYDEVRDPGELENLAADPAYADTRADLKAQLYDLIRATGAVPGVPQGSWQPQGTYAQPTFLLRNSNTPGPADISFRYGQDGDVALTCDWDGDGIDTAGVFRAGTFYLRNSNSGGQADKTFGYGRPTDVPLCGDWNSNGVDTIGVFRDGLFYLRNSNSAGDSNVAVAYGQRDDIPVTGDWNADGSDSIGVVRAGMWYLSNSNRQPRTVYRFGYGNDGDQPLTGDWNGDGTDTVAVRRGKVDYLKNSLAPGNADVTVGYGSDSDRGLAGNWDGVGSDTIGVVRD